MKKTYALTAPVENGVRKWLFDPYLQRRDGGRHFRRTTGVWHDRGFKKDAVIIMLVEVDEHGNEGRRRVYSLAPCDGYARDLPTEKRYYIPGEHIATFEEGYTYHWRFYGQEYKRGARVFAVTCRKFPRVLYGLNFGLGLLIGIVGYMLTLTDWEFPTFIGRLALLGALSYALLYGLLTLFGREYVHLCRKTVAECTPFWILLSGLIGSGMAYVVGHEFVEDGFGIYMIPLGVMSLLSFAAMFGGLWVHWSVLTGFLKKRMFRF